MLDVKPSLDGRMHRDPKVYSGRRPEIITYSLEEDKNVINEIMETACETEYILFRIEKKSKFVALPREQYMSEWIN